MVEDALPGSVLLYHCVMLSSQHNEVLSREVGCPEICPCTVSPWQYQRGQLTETPLLLWTIYLQNWLVRKTVASAVTTFLRSSALPTSRTLVWYGCCNLEPISLPQHEAVNRVTEAEIKHSTFLRNRLLRRRKSAHGTGGVTSRCRRVRGALVHRERMNCMGISTLSHAEGQSMN